MKTFWSLVLFLHFTTGGMLLEELSHASALVRHYRLHKVAQPQLSFRGFLQMHYANLHHQLSDSRHRTLPFNNTHEHNGTKVKYHQMLLSLLLGSGGVSPYPIPKSDSYLPQDFSSIPLQPPQA